MILRWLRKIFTRRQGRPAVSMEPFPPLDKEFVRRETRLLEAARNDGGNDSPDTRATSESATERNIRNFCERQLDKYIDALNSERHEYAMRLNRILDTWRVNAVEGEEAALVDDVVADGKKDIGPIDASANRLKHLADELHTYRATHDLTHRLPVCHDVWKAVLLLLIWFAGELLVTTFLLMESGGLAMVLIVSTVYCFLNCFFPFAAAPFSRSINYRSGHLGGKAMGWGLLLAVVGIGIWLNLLMGHYRSAALELAAIDLAGSDLESLEVLVERVNSTGVTAWSNLIETPLGITDTFSWMLAVAGLIAFALSFWEGFVRDDIYPRYGALYRRFDDQRETYDEDVDDLIDSLKARRERGVKKIEAKKRQLVEDLGRIPQLNQRIQVLDSKFEGACGALSSDFSELIDEYRRENRNFRASPEPQYFNPPVHLREFRPEKLDLHIEPTGEQAKMMVEKLSHFSARLHEEFKALTARVRPSSDILLLDPLQISSSSS